SVTTGYHPSDSVAVLAEIVLFCPCQERLFGLHWQGHFLFRDLWERGPVQEEQRIGVLPSTVQHSVRVGVLSPPAHLEQPSEGAGRGEFTLLRGELPRGVVRRQ